MAEDGQNEPRKGGETALSEELFSGHLQPASIADA
jgi:hypothetical protein